MLLFCPVCGNLLTISEHHNQMLICHGCPYLKPIGNNKVYKERTVFPRKQVDDILGGAQAWENVDATDAQCPKCDHGRAYYMQIQIRSADEPSSIFYKCCECQHQWREG